jgi:LysR family glycine cleavage system transcriptional activator
LYPDIQVRALASAQYEDVRHSEIDVAIRQGEKQIGNVHQETLILDPIFPVCSPKVLEEYGLTKPKHINKCWLVEAIDHTCNKPSNGFNSPSNGFSWNDWSKLAGISINNKQKKWIEVNSWEMGINAVLSGHGIFLTSGCMAQDLIESGALVKPFDIQIEPGLKFSLLYDEESPRIVRIKVFTDWLKNELQV